MKENTRRKNNGTNKLSISVRKVSAKLPPPSLHPSAMFHLARHASRSLPPHLFSTLAMHSFTQSRDHKNRKRNKQLRPSRSLSPSYRSLLLPSVKCPTGRFIVKRVTTSPRETKTRVRSKKPYYLLAKTVLTGLVGCTFCF